MIVSADSAITRLNRVQVVPLTSNVQRRYPGEALVIVQGRRSKALATQLMTVDKAQVFDYEGVPSAADLAAVGRAIREQLAL